MSFLDNTLLVIGIALLIVGIVFSGSGIIYTNLEYGLAGVLFLAFGGFFTYLSIKS